MKRGYPEHRRDDVPLQRQAKKKAYYAFPLKQQTMHIQYWADLLQNAGYKDSDIPKTWKEYWSFWCDIGAGRPAQEDRQARLRIGIPWVSISTRSTRSDLQDATTSDWWTTSKLLVDDPS